MKPQFIFGEETFSVDEQVRGIVSPFSSQERDVFEGQFEMSDLVQAGSMSGLFASQKAIILKNPWFLSKAPTDGELEQLTSFLSTSEEAGHVVVIYQLGSVDQRKKAAGILKKACESTQHQPFKDWEQDKVLSWISQRGQALGKTVGRDAALALEEIGGTNLRQLAGELEKCVVYVGDRPDITADDIKALCASASASIFDFNEALKGGRISQAMLALRRLLSHGEDPVKLLGLITSNVRMYYQLLAYSSEGKSVDSIASLLGKNPYFLKRLIPEVKRAYDLKRITAAYAACADTDFHIKSGRMKPEVALELLVGRI